jgi:ribonuclease PH
MLLLSSSQNIGHQQILGLRIDMRTTGPEVVDVSVQVIVAQQSRHCCRQTGTSMLLHESGTAITTRAPASLSRLPIAACFASLKLLSPH